MQKWTGVGSASTSKWPKYWCYYCSIQNLIIRSKASTSKWPTFWCYYCSSQNLIIISKAKEFLDGRGRSSSWMGWSCFTTCVASNNPWQGCKDNLLPTQLVEGLLSARMEPSMVPFLVKDSSLATLHKLRSTSFAFLIVAFEGRPLYKRQMVQVVQPTRRAQITIWE